jgi:hypothetical protein
MKLVAMDFVATQLHDESSLMNVLPTHPLHRELIERVMKDDEPIAGLFRRGQGLRFDEEALPHNAAELFIAANLIRGNGSQVQDDVSLTEAVNVER